MDGKRSKTQATLALEGRGEALDAETKEIEPLMASPATESPARTEDLMEEVCDRANLEIAWRRVRRNKGGPGVDGMTIDDTKVYLREHWPTIRSQLLKGAYQPQPVKRAHLPKPGGGIRKLGVPCVVDRLIQQAVLQVLQPRWDPTLSEHSFGFRPGRSAHQAVAQAQRYVAEGYDIVVDLDLEKFFDRVQRDRLMARLAKRISDKRVLKLIRAFLKPGVMEDGLVNPVEEGTPQGGPLSPFLSNVVLDELDQELTRRGHRFSRYGDDCNIYVQSHRAGERVMASVSRFLTKKLRLKVNETKSAVARPDERQFLGFSLSNDGRERRIAPQALARFKKRVRDLTHRTKGVSLSKLIKELAPYLVGWRGYILRLLPDSEGALQPRGIDPPKAPCLPLVAMAKCAQAFQGTAPPRRAQVPSSGCRRFTDEFLAYVQSSGGANGPAQSLFRRGRSPPTSHRCSCLTQSNRLGTDPYARWCGRGGVARLPPIPINP